MRNLVWLYYGYYGGSSRSSLLIRPVLRELLKTAGSLAASKLNEQVCVSLSSMQTLQRSTWKVETCLKSCYQYAVVKTRCTLKTLLRITPPYPAKWFWSFVRWLCFSSPYFFCSTRILVLSQFWVFPFSPHSAAILPQKCGTIWTGGVSFSKLS